METIADFSPLFTAGIFFIGTLSFLLVGVNSLLSAKIDPVKKDIARLEANQIKFQANLTELHDNQVKLQANQVKLQANQQELASDVRELKGKMDRLLACLEKKPA